MDWQINESTHSRDPPIHLLVPTSIHSWTSGWMKAPARCIGGQKDGDKVEYTFDRED